MQKTINLFGESRVAHVEFIDWVEPGLAMFRAFPSEEAYKAQPRTARLPDLIDEQAGLLAAAAVEEITLSKQEADETFPEVRAATNKTQRDKAVAKVQQEIDAKRQEAANAMRDAKNKGDALREELANSPAIFDGELRSLIMREWLIEVEGEPTKANAIAAFKAEHPDAVDAA